ncbi:magnesium transporter CorA family protein [Psychromarinibacter sediminicola]|nr:magnesium transporter CorA family protein [Psychromarinibacter sediminicola]
MAYRTDGRGLQALTIPGSRLEDRDAPVPALPDDAIWIDLYRPLDRQVEAVRALGIEVPTLEEMEEIEISSRLYRVDTADYMTVILPGQSDGQERVSGPVTFILTAERLVTVRHHAPRSFQTFANRPERAVADCTSPERVFVSLLDEIIARLADLLEGAGEVLDANARDVFGEAEIEPEDLQAALKKVGRQGELIGQVRLALLSLERALIFFGNTKRESTVRDLTKGLIRDVKALAVHSDYLSSRIGLTVDATLGMINLEQNATARILSVVAVLFLPPTLVASIFGMNFTHMDILDWPLGFPGSLFVMLVSAVGTYVVFKWKNWL